VRLKNGQIPLLNSENQIFNMPLLRKTYVGFWPRFFALVIDTILLGIVYWLISFSLFFTGYDFFTAFIIGILVYILVDAIYEIVLIWKRGATIGKFLMGVKITDKRGKNISLLTSIGRYFAKMLSAIILGIGYLMIIWDPKKQGLHDELLNTYALENTKSRVSKKVKKAMIILVIVGILAYIFYAIFIYTIYINSMISAAINGLDPENPLASLTSQCDAKPFWEKDYCYFAYSQTDKSFLALTAEQRIEGCSYIQNPDLHMVCLQMIAVTEGDESICTHAKSPIYVKQCEEAVSFTAPIFNIIEKYMPKVFSGTLNVEKVTVGTTTQEEHCIERGSNIFYNEDEICFEFNNISEFEIGDDDLHWYDIDVKTIDEDGEIVSLMTNIYDEYGHIFMSNGILESTGIISYPDTYPPGEYLYEITIYDRISNRGIIINRTIIITESP